MAPAIQRPQRDDSGAARVSLSLCQPPVSGAHQRHYHVYIAVGVGGAEDAGAGRVSNFQGDFAPAQHVDDVGVAENAASWIC